MAISFVKSLGFSVSGQARSVGSTTGHAVGDVALVVASTGANTPDPSVSGGTYNAANLTDLGVVTTSGTQSTRVKFRVWIYEVDSTAAWDIVFTDVGSLNGASGAIWRGIDPATAYLDTTNGGDNDGTSVSIPTTGTVASGNLVVGLWISGADTNSDILASVTGTNLRDIVRRLQGHSSTQNGKGHYYFEGFATATSCGPFTGTATISDRWSAASILFKEAGGGPPTITGSGGITAGSAVLSGSGTVQGQVAGTGAISAPASVLSGTGAVEGPVVGTGAISAPSVVLDGSGDVTVIGSGAITSPSVVLAGTGAIAGTIIGSGAFVAPSSVLSGTGGVGDLIFGSGGITVPSVTLNGDGDVIITGIGSIQSPAPVLSGSGVAQFAVTGSGGIVASAAVLQGLGGLEGIVIGSGGIIAPSAVIDGIGDVDFEKTDIYTQADSPLMRWFGDFATNKAYPRGSVVSQEGSLFLSLTNQNRTATSSASWRQLT